MKGPKVRHPYPIMKAHRLTDQVRANAGSPPRWCPACPHAIADHTPWCSKCPCLHRTETPTKETP